MSPRIRPPSSRTISAVSTYSIYVEAAKEMGTFRSKTPDPWTVPKRLRSDKLVQYGRPPKRRRSWVNIADVDFTTFARKDEKDDVEGHESRKQTDLRRKKQRLNEREKGEEVANDKENGRIAVGPDDGDINASSSQKVDILDCDEQRKDVEDEEDWDELYGSSPSTRNAEGITFADNASGASQDFDDIDENASRIHARQDSSVEDHDHSDNPGHNIEGLE
ncbi:uncharacterized protein LTHEOB_5105 [Lasiodiplodia theobromae]|uniref:uncharacterized protein n=1 Tax=Lasiodiplodia theobromae TaxID=45133 RepID=UPI0015C31307|nr:uncharacterized protein LTHEOB_5105 [Lasiodiplodia theobromae]KAF4545272.1 hypothetical protein LTHEOB_5105 [Lasiodiplodia theobromae]